MAGKKKTKRSKKARSTSKKPPKRKRAKSTPKVRKPAQPLFKKDTFVAVKNRKSPDYFTIYKVYMFKISINVC